MFMMKLFLVVALVKLLLNTNRPAQCAGIYTAGSFLLSLIFGRPFLFAVIASAISFAFALLYFWLLDKFEESSLFWVILILGLLVGLV